MYRTVDCLVWHDPWFEGLKPNSKLVFLNLITNQRQTACGVFEITSKALSFEVGLNVPTLEGILKALEPKVRWWPEYNTIWVCNFYARQRANSNDLFVKGARKALLDFEPTIQQIVCGAIPELVPVTVSHTNPIPIPLGNETVTVTETVNSIPLDNGIPKTPARSVSLPKDFEVTADMKEWAKEKYSMVDLEYQTEQFCDYYRAHATPMKDWTAAWRKWIGKAYEFGLAKGTLNGKANSANEENLDRGLRASQESDKRRAAKEAALAKLIGATGDGPQ